MVAIHAFIASTIGSFLAESDGTRLVVLGIVGIGAFGTTDKVKLQAPFDLASISIELERRVAAGTNAASIDASRCFLHTGVVWCHHEAVTTALTFSNLIVLETVGISKVADTFVRNKPLLTLQTLSSFGLNASIELAVVVVQFVGFHAYLTTRIEEFAATVDLTHLGNSVETEWFPARDDFGVDVVCSWLFLFAQSVLLEVESWKAGLTHPTVIVLRAVYVHSNTVVATQNIVLCAVLTFVVFDDSTLWKPTDVVIQNKLFVDALNAAQFIVLLTSLDHAAAIFECKRSLAATAHAS